MSSLTRHSPSSARSRMLMLGSAACFITNVLLIRTLGGLEQVSVALITSVRFLTGLVIVCTAFRREFQPKHLFTRAKLVERGVLGGICTYGFYFTVPLLGAGRATFINNTYVIWGALFAVWALKETLRPAIIIGATVTFLGLTLLTAPFSQSAASSLHDLLGLAVALGAAWIVVTIRKLHHTEHSSTIFASQCVYGLIICAGPALHGLHSLSASTIALLILAGVCASVGQLLMTHAYRKLSVAEGSLIQMLVPAGIALGGAVFFHEHFTAVEIIGAALILTGTAAPALFAPRSNNT